MGIVQLNEKEAINEIQNWYNAYISPTKRNGSVAIVQWVADKKTKGKTWEKRTWINQNKIRELINASNGVPERLTNAYLTLNAFKVVGEAGSRTTSNLAQIRNIGIDIDCYTVGMTPEQAENAIQDMIVQCEIPNPNLLIRSGNGVQLVYSIEGGAAPSLAWLTKYITVQFVAKTAFLGSDASCTDLTRVFRLPGSFNVKSGQAKKLASSEIWRKREYDLSELYAYCEPLEHRQKRVKRPHLYPLPKLTDMGHKIRSLNLTRINDFYKLIDLREGKIEKRNVLLYDFAYCFGLQTDLEDAVIQQATRMNDSLDDPLSAFEVERVARNAYKDARTFWKAFSENGYKKLPYRLNDGIIKPKLNTTLIEHHSITAAEMKDLQTIIDGDEKQARRVAKRRAAGMKTLEEHNSNQKQQKAQRLYLLAKLKAENPGATQRQLAGLMGVSLPTLKKYVAELKQKV